MSLLLGSEPVPLNRLPDGTIRITGTRVPLDTVVGAFIDGSTPEEIVQQYPTLSLENTYWTISFYLRHRDEVDAYLEQRRAEADEIRRENEARFDPTGVRARLLARKTGSA